MLPLATLSIDDEGGYSFGKINSVQSQLSVPLFPICFLWWLLKRLYDSGVGGRGEPLF